MSAMLIDELRAAGLLAGIEPMLTQAGRQWMAQIEDLDADQATKDLAADEWEADLVCSVNGLSR